MNNRMLNCGFFCLFVFCKEIGVGLIFWFVRLMPNVILWMWHKGAYYLYFWWLLHMILLQYYLCARECWTCTIGLQCSISCFPPWRGWNRIGESTRQETKVVGPWANVLTKESKGLLTFLKNVSWCFPSASFLINDTLAFMQIETSCTHGDINLMRRFILSP